MIKRKKRYRQVSTISVLLLVVGGLSLTAGWVLMQRFEPVSWKVSAPLSLQQKIEESMQMMSPQGLWSARPALIQQELLQRIPDIARVQVQRTLPSSLHIKAEARVVIALWQQPGGRVMLIDDHGQAFRPLARGELMDYPLLRLDAQHLAAASSLLTSMKQGQSAWLAALSEVFADIDGWRLNLSSGQQWLLPFGEKGIESVSRITAMLQHSRWHAGVWRVHARQENRWFVRPAKYQGVI